VTGVIVLFGWKVRWKAVGGGTFHCPVEGQARSYELREGRRWFTLFFVPLIPLKVLGRHVRCQGCGTELDPSVLATHGIEQSTR
jgi:hypothetical protein